MFPENFVWGVASSAYQIEGTDPDDGRDAEYKFRLPAHIPIHFYSPALPGVCRQS